MGMIESASPAVKSLQGLHLYHTERSNCAGRVRLLLEEKHLPWVSHPIDLKKKEQVTEEYFSINPKGVVPTLVDDGRVIVESNDILLYLEEKCPAPGFTPASREEQSAMRAWLKRSTDIHVPGVKTFVYANFDPAQIERSVQEAAHYRALQKDPELLAFHARHDPGKRFTREDTDRAVAVLRAAFRDMEADIARAGWLAGGGYCLADISWAPTIALLLGGNFSFQDFPGLMQWYGRIAQRPAWGRAMRFH